MSVWEQEGWDACMRGIEDWECPYGANSLATARRQTDWLRGWDMARNRLRISKKR